MHFSLGQTEVVEVIGEKENISIQMADSKLRHFKLMDGVNLDATICFRYFPAVHWSFFPQ